MDNVMWNYLVFIALIVVTTIAPLWGILTGGSSKQVKKKDEYVFATGKVSMLAMMVSIARTTLGVRSFLGFPSELYYHGIEMWETLYGYVSAYPIVCFVFIPVYFNLGITSAYQYLDMRFNSRLVRCLASASFILRQLLNQGVTLYTPTVALNKMIGIPYWASLGSLTAITIGFNLLGGLKNAIKADVIQTITTILVTFVIIVQGFYNGGGVKKSIEVTKNAGRLEFLQFSGDMTVRVDTFSAWLGQLFITTTLFGCQQNYVQRYLSMPSLKKVMRMMMSNIPIVIFLFTLSWIAGIGIFATYFNCDPLLANITKKEDELLPYFVEDQLDYIPGFTGLFLGCLFNGALALNVSNLNSISTVTWEDFVSKMPYFRNYKDKQHLHIIRIFAVFYGVLIMGVSFSVGLLSGVIESSMLMTSATSGPLLGAFSLAILFPVANWKGTATGMIVSQIGTAWLIYGNFAHGHTRKSIHETRIDGCYNGTSEAFHQSHWTGGVYNNETKAIHYEDVSSNMNPLTQLYSVSYMYYSVFSTLLTIFIGIVISYLTQSKEDAYESKLVHPFVLRFTRWLPGKQRFYTDNKAVNCFDNPTMKSEVLDEVQRKTAQKVVYSETFRKMAVH